MPVARLAFVMGIVGGIRMDGVVRIIRAIMAIRAIIGFIRGVIEGSEVVFRGFLLLSIRIIRIKIARLNKNYKVHGE